MKRTFRLLLLASCAILVLMNGCRKRTDNNANAPYYPGVSASPPPTTFPVTTTTPSLNKVFSDLRTTPQVITVTAGVASTVFGASGTRFNFYPSSFRDASGNIITSGTVTLKLVEMLKPGAMIANRATTTVNDTGRLKSGGQIYIEASMGGQEVFARKYGIGFEQPSVSSTPMALYYGNIKNTDSVVMWGTPNTALGMIVSSTDSIPDTTSGGGGSGGGGGGGGGGWGGWGTGIYYQFDSCTDFHWVNCDHFGGWAGAKTDVKVTIADTGFNHNNTEVFLVFPTDNSVSNASWNYSSTAPLTFRNYNLPVGLSMTVVVVAKKYGQYYYYELTGATVTTTMVVPATLAPQTLAYVQAKLAAL